MLQRFSLILGFLLIAVVVTAQEIEFYAQADARQIVVGNYFEVTFTLENANGESFTPPDFGDLEVLSGPSQSSQMSIINGRRSQKISFGYGLTVSKPGKYTIKSATIKVAGNTYRSQPITIEAVAGKAGTKNTATGVAGLTDSDIFIEAVVDRDTGYIGQQITLKYVLYTTKDVRSINLAQKPEFDGFFAQEINNYRERSQRVVRDGVQYVSRAVKVISLFPQQKGTFDIDPALFTLGISTKSGRSSFFFSNNLKRVNVRTEPFTLQVTDLPDNAPASFAGAIGDFYLGTAIDRKQLSRDDALTLTFQIKGDGDGKLLTAPDQPLGDLFDIYEPNLLREENGIENGKIITTKTYEYLMIPKKEGRISFNPELSFYDPDLGEYSTIKGQNYTITVTPSTGRQTVDLDTRHRELPDPITTTSFKKKDSFFFGSAPYWALNGGLGLAFLGLLFAKKRQLDRGNIDPAELKNSKAKKLAIAQLSEAKSAWSAGDTKQFYILLRKGLLEYLASKTYQSSAQMSKEDISTLLMTNDLESYEAGILNIMQKGEMAIYANMTPGNEEDSYNEAIEIIQNIETSLKK
jgi:hypothetical protein